ncbi:hypothetical protein GE09DRAFT_1195193, partial [Coniochaeta sp. 2T2.1]
MKLHHFVAGITAALLATFIAEADTGPSKFTVTALTSRDGYSVFECWQLASLPVEAMSATNFEIGNTTKATWSIIEPRTTVGEAWAPAVQSIRLPHASASSTISLTPFQQTLPDPQRPNPHHRPLPHILQLLSLNRPGHDLIQRHETTRTSNVRASSYIRGHYTEFPSDEPAVLVQVPFVGNRVPGHVILHDGAC